MTFTLDTHWVWDFWLADDGDQFHMYYLHAPKSLGDQNLRHRNARIGHATSTDLSTWTDLGEVLAPGGAGQFDETATWTGSIVQDDAGVWRMFYTGSRFLTTGSHTNIETVGYATSTDLHNWVKAPGPVAEAAHAWYERLGTSNWPEEAWRDPWVFPDAAGTWHMLITARANNGDDLDRGVIGHATSGDLTSWTVQPALSEPGAGFKHLEVPQIANVDGRYVLLFSCDSTHLAGHRAGQEGGIWALEVASPVGPFDITNAQLLTPERLYSGRLIQDRAGQWNLLAFENSTADGDFVGVLADPIPVTWSAPDGPLTLLTKTEELA